MGRYICRLCCQPSPLQQTTAAEPSLSSASAWLSSPFWELGLDAVSTARVANKAKDRHYVPIAAEQDSGAETANEYSDGEAKLHAHG